MTGEKLHPLDDTADRLRADAERIKALERPARWEVRLLDDGMRRLIFWTQDNREAAWLNLTTEQAKDLAAALLRGKP